MQSDNKERESLFFSSDRVGDCRGFSLFGSRRNVMPSIFGGRDPFDDPFFNRPFNDMSESSIYGPRVSSNDKMSNDGAAGIVIEELDSDVDEDEGTKSTEGAENQKHYGSKKEPSVLHPDDVDDEIKNNDKFERVQPEARHRHSVQTCKVTYGGVDGAYFTSTRTRKADSDGVVIEERKEANRTTGQATHRISRGIHNKGHSVTRMLNSDGKVETVQTLHNLSSDDLSGFEEAWKDNCKGEFSMSKDGYEFGGSSGSSTTRGNQKANWGGFLPQSSEEKSRTVGQEVQMRSNSSAGKKKKVIRINIE